MYLSRKVQFKVRAGDLTGMGQELGLQLQLLLDILGATAGPAIPPDPVGSSPFASLNLHPGCVQLHVEVHQPLVSCIVQTGGFDAM